MLKNVAGQKLTIYAHDTIADVAKTGDAANITMFISKNGAAAVQSNDVNPTELDNTNLPGIYVFDLTQAESNADMIIFSASSSTSTIQIEPIVVFTKYTTNQIGDAVSDAVCDEPLSEHITLGTLGRKISDITLTGLGTVAVDHNYGGTDALRYVDGVGSGIDNADIVIYLKSDYDAGNLAAGYVKAKTNTDVNGRWANPLNLDPATYTIYFYKQGEYGPDTQEITVT